MSAGADAGRAPVELPRSRLGVGHELLQRFHAEVRVHHQEEREGEHQRDRIEVALDVHRVAADHQRRQHDEAVGGEQDGVAVGAPNAPPPCSRSSRSRPACFPARSSGRMCSSDCRHRAGNSGSVRRSRSARSPAPSATASRRRCSGRRPIRRARSKVRPPPRAP